MALKLLTAFRDGGYTAHQDAAEAIRAARHEGARMALKRAAADFQAMADDTDNDVEWVDAYQNAADALRAQLKELDQ